MYYETMPLYPALHGDCEADRCVRVPMFNGDDGSARPGCPPPELRCVRRVTIENPCCPGERVEVLLGLDACGNLVVCVHREGDPCSRPPRPCRPPRPGRIKDFCSSS